MMRAAVVPCLLLAAALATADLAGTGPGLERAGRGLADALGPDHAARHAFDDAERFDLRLAPFRLEGLTLREMDPGQRDALWSLVDAPLSAAGRSTARAIMALETEVARAEREAGFPRSLARFVVDRDPEAYHVTLYGEPGAGEPWGFRFDGHHLSLNVTQVPGETPSTTPLFLGAQPRRVPAGGSPAGSMVLGEQERLARELYASLSGAQRAAATLPWAGQRELMRGTARRLGRLPPPEGLARGAMSSGSRRRLDALLESYLGLLDADLAGARRREIRAAGLDAVHLAWSGGEGDDAPLYYRLQGPALLIEFDNSEPAASHIHVLWRDPRRDYGLDLLAEHRARLPH